MEITNEALYCKKCSLQFDKKIVYDIHLSFVHKMNIEVKSEEKTVEIKEEEEANPERQDDQESAQGTDS